MKNNSIRLILSTIGLSILLLCSFAAEIDCTVRGTIKGINKETKLLVLRRVGEHGADTVKQAQTKADGSFSFTIPAKQCNEMYDLRVDNVRSSISFIAEKGMLEINSDVKSLYTAELKGTPANEQWNRYSKASLAITMKSNKMMMSGELTKLTKEEKTAFYKGLEDEKKRYTDSLITNYPGSILSLYLAKEPLPMMKHHQIDSVLSIFKPYFAQHPYYLTMKKRADILRKVAPGAIAPDFTVLKPDGKSKITLSSFRGKYVMLDFWASWCVPCRAENVHTKELFEKYSPHGLEVISFSLDSDLEAWNTALKKDGLIWSNASDLVGGVRSPVAKKYGIDGIPAIWIIDPRGKIIAEGIRGETLARLLESIFIKTKG